MFAFLEWFKAISNLKSCFLSLLTFFIGHQLLNIIPIQQVTIKGAYNSKFQTVRRCEYDIIRSRLSSWISRMHVYELNRTSRYLKFLWIPGLKRFRVLGRDHRALGTVPGVWATLAGMKNQTRIDLIKMINNNGVNYTSDQRGLVHTRPSNRVHRPCSKDTKQITNKIHKYTESSTVKLVYKWLAYSVDLLRLLQTHVSVHKQTPLIL